MPVRSLASSVLRWPDREAVDRAVRTWAAEVARADERILRVGYFGSYARGEATRDSDIDVMIVLRDAVKPTEEIDRISEAVADICLRHDILISTFPVSQEWFAERQSPFFINVRREGVLV